MLRSAAAGLDPQFCWPDSAVSDAVVAIDFNSGERIELLAESPARVETGGS